MARGRGPGGYQKPANPAPVSGPGRLSQRTDGGPGDLRFTGLPYGQNKQVNDLAAAAPMASSPGVPAEVRAPGPLGGVFGPTALPDQPMTAGLGQDPAPEVLGDETDLLIRALIANHPHLADRLLPLLGG